MRGIHRFLLASLCAAAPLLHGCRGDAGDAAARKAEAVLAQSTGLAFLRRDQLPEAEAEFKKVVQLAPRDPAGHANLALTYLRAGRYAEAERALERARRLAPSSVEVALMRARLYVLTRRPTEAREVLEQLPRGGPDNARVLHALAELEAQAPGGRDGRRHEELLKQVLALKPANLAVRLELLNLALRRGQADSVLRQLEDVRRLPPELPREARTILDETIQLLRAGRLPEASASLDRFLRTIEVTPQYQVALNEVKWVEAPLIGRAVLTFEPQSLITLLGSGFIPLKVDTARFVDVTTDAGFPEPAVTGRPAPADAAALAAGDLDGEGTDDLFASSRLYRVQRGYVLDGTESAGISLSAAATAATFGDFDNDGWLDLFIATADGQGRLLRNTGSSRLEDVTVRAGRFNTQGARSVVFVDPDHDGDLDLLIAGSERRVYRNNLDGTFTESAAAMGLAGRGEARSVRFADFDLDGRVDVFITNADIGDMLYRNVGGGRFSDATPASG